MNTLSKFLIALVPLTFLVGCPSGTEDNNPAGTDSPTENASNKVIFRPFVRQLPFPTNLFFSGTTDATVNITVGLDSPVVQTLNDIDGYSTIAPMTFNVGTAIDPATLSANVHVFHLCSDATGSKAPIQPGADGKLVEGTDYSVGVSSLTGNNLQIVIKPLKPLRPMFDATTGSSTACGMAAANAGGLAANAYSVVVTNGLLTADGDAFAADDIYVLAKAFTPYIDQNGPTAAGAALGYDNETLGQLESIRQLTNGLEGLADVMTGGNGSPAGPPTGTVSFGNSIMSFNFSTQSIGVTMGQVANLAAAGTATIGPVSNGAGGILNTSNINAALPPVADIYAGTISIPYYLETPSAGNPTAPLNTRWRANPATALDGTSTNLSFANSTPVKQTTTDINIPVLLTIPNANSSCMTTNFRTVIFQHGITGNRTNMFGIAPALAAAPSCAAVIAIDLPLHGITDTASPFYVAPGANTGERTFNVDYVNNATSAPGPDGNFDSSGTHFINLSSLITSRDNTRQAAADLLTLAVTIPGISVSDGQTTYTLNGADIHFVGHSLGGIVGTTFLGTAAQFDALSLAASGPTKFNIGASTLAMPGGGIAKLLDASGAFGPVVTGGLAGAGVSQGTPDFESFLRAAQTAVDSADPLNYAKIQNGLPTAPPIHMIEVVGGAGGASAPFNAPDTVVPNDAFNPVAGVDDTTPEPGLGGTNPLAAALGLTGAAVSTFDDDSGAVAGPRLVRFKCGNHSTILDPSHLGDGDYYLGVTMEMQSQTVQFILGDGAGFTMGAGPCPTAPPVADP